MYFCNLVKISLSVGISSRSVCNLKIIDNILAPFSANRYKKSTPLRKELKDL